MRKVYIFSTILVFLVAAGASAGTITSINPTSVMVASGEYFVTITGTGLGDNVSFVGGGANFVIAINARTSSNVTCWIPMAVTNTAGHYTIQVLGGTGDSNLVGFDVLRPLSLGLTLYLPELVKLQAATREGAFIKYDVVASGGSDPNPTVTCTPASGSLFPLGTTTVQCTATNSQGERASGAFDATAYDGAAPVVSVPKSFSVESPGPDGVAVKYDASASDDIDGVDGVACAPASGDVFPVGVTTVNCRAADAWGNTGGASFDVNVVWKSIVIHVPDKVVAEAQTAKGANVFFDVTAASPDDPNPQIKCDPLSGSFFTLGGTTVTCTATDRLGNSASGRFDVNVVDTVGPTVSDIYAKPNWILPNGSFTTVAVGVTPVDVVDPAPKCAITGVTANETITPDDYRILDDSDVALLGVTKGKENRVYAVLVRCTDASLNSTDANVNVTVSETAPPPPLSNAPVPATPPPPRRRAN